MIPVTIAVSPYEGASVGMGHSLPMRSVMIAIYTTMMAVRQFVSSNLEPVGMELSREAWGSNVNHGYMIRNFHIAAIRRIVVSFLSSVVMASLMLANNATLGKLTPIVPMLSARKIVRSLVAETRPSKSTKNAMMEIFFQMTVVTASVA
ncbi:hypothetical protein A2635_00305 [Candidatus Peribacteria bacterium RIFCSPHIGHO2_01_FULL_51_9]|nr:MAG: hypothetical protein A2635_00305 [Candidatus Peribacteria bacterium RIFCSPHIGHO2_01_FULL_51_9]